jgi:signal transduction histidine kinase/ActR/RegA family two-component response regulator
MNPTTYLVLATPVVLALLLAFAVQNRLERGGPAGYWAVAWGALWLSGLGTAFEGFAGSGFLAHFLSPFFSFFMLGGARAAAGRDTPRSWLALLGAGALLKALAFSEFGPIGGTWVGLPLEAPLLRLAGVNLRAAAAAEPELRAQRALVWAFAAVSSLYLIEVARPQFLPGTTIATALWVGGAMGMILCHTLALAERRLVAEQALLAAEARRVQEQEEDQRLINTALAMVPSGLALMDATGCILRLNEAYAEHLGLGEPSDWIGRTGGEVMESLLDRFAPDVRYWADEGRWFSLARQRTLNDEIRLQDPERILAVWSQAVRAEDGHGLGRIWMTRDLTDERQLAARLQRAERMETLGTLAGGLAHDFNNQLTAILGGGELVRDHLDGAGGELLDDMMLAANHCAGLTQGLLSFAQQRPADPQAVSLAEALDDVQTLLRPSLDVAVQLIVEDCSALPPLWADALGLQRVLLNLLLNARDAIGGSGTIRVSASHSGGDAIDITVSDDGRGIPPELQEQVFEPFFTTKAVGEGTGLGLAVVFGLARSHGARIHVDSEPGRGSRFHLSWPRAGTRVESSHGSRVAAGRLSGTECVLVAEDEDAVRQLIRRALEQRGFQVLEARDGEEALKRFRDAADQIDCLLFDVHMPRMGGVEALAEIRAEAPQLPALLMSGRLDAHSVESVTEVGCLPKPFRTEVLVDRLRAVLDRARPAHFEVPADPAS